MMGPMNAASRAKAPATFALLPAGPGVYRFRAETGSTLYIGRATNLRSRVFSYWGNLGDRKRLARMVAQIARVEAVACDSTHEAAWLERNLLDSGGRAGTVRSVARRCPSSSGWTAV